MGSEGTGCTTSFSNMPNDDYSTLKRNELPSPEKTKKTANLKKLRTIQLQLYDIIEEAKLQGP